MPSIYPVYSFSWRFTAHMCLQMAASVNHGRSLRHLAVTKIPNVYAGGYGVTAVTPLFLRTGDQGKLGGKFFAS